MNHKIAVIALGLSLLASLPSVADDLGINVVLEGEVAPGVYGRVELGKGSHPAIYYPEPLVIVHEPKYSNYQPVYLHVPPGHAKHWRKHCHKYHACERPVYFIKSVEYAESYQREHSHDHHQHSDKKHKDKQHNKEKSNHKDKNNKH